MCNRRLNIVYRYIELSSVLTLGEIFTSLLFDFSVDIRRIRLKDATSRPTDSRRRFLIIHLPLSFLFFQGGCDEGSRLKDPVSRRRR